jgi:mono/diheme cytochrome c family protein
MRAGRNLVRPGRPLPEGEGKNLVQKVCNDCHGPENYLNKHMDKDGWEKVVSDMVEKGATGTDQEYDIVVAYLTKNFGKKN